MENIACGLSHMYDVKVRYDCVLVNRQIYLMDTYVVQVVKDGIVGYAINRMRDAYFRVLLNYCEFSGWTATGSYAPNAVTTEKTSSLELCGDKNGLPV